MHEQDAIKTLNPEKHQSFFFFFYETRKIQREIFILHMNIIFQENILNSLLYPNSTFVSQFFNIQKRREIVQ